MPGRHKSRERALQVLFQIDARKIEPEEAIQHFYTSLYSTEDFPEERLESDPFMEELVHGTLLKMTEIDDLITRHSTHWRIERMPVVDRNLLRMSIFELMKGQLSAAVVIDEALELSRRFSGRESAGFINGVLDAAKSSVAAAKAP